MGTDPLTIEWLEDEHDCELCGSSYATGAIVRKDGEIILRLEPFAHCYGGDSWTEDKVYEKLKELGYQMTTVPEYFTDHDYELLTDTWDGVKGAAYNVCVTYCYRNGLLHGFDEKGSPILTEKGKELINIIKNNT